MKITLNKKHLDPWKLREQQFFIDNEIDPYECKKHVGEYRCCLHDFEEDYPLRKVLNVFWSTPCGYWTLCWVLEGTKKYPDRTGPYMNNCILTK